MKAFSKRSIAVLIILVMVLGIMFSLSGCANSPEAQGKTVVTMIQYKQEALDIFQHFQDEFNATHDDIYLKIESPSDAMTVLKTRLIREDAPDIIGFGGDVNYSNFVDAKILADVTDYEGLKKVNPSYVEMLESLEYVPTEGTFAVPYVANAAGVLYNKDMFEEHNWQIPTNWNEFISRCEQMQSEGILPLYFGYKDTWTCLAPWNAIAIQLAPADVCYQVNQGATTFKQEYRAVAEKQYELLQYAEDGPFAYGYNDACIEFANGGCAMYTIGSYAVPQILLSNPDINIGSFVMPAADKESDLILNSGIDLMFAVSESCEHKEAAFTVIDYLLEDASVQAYLDNQNSVPCVQGDFETSSVLDLMMPYIESGRMADFQDHHYPSEMSVDAMIQTFLINHDMDTFLDRFDSYWIRYNKDIIRKVQDYEAAHADSK